MRKFLREDQDKIEDALSSLVEELCGEVGILGAAIKVCCNGDVSAEFLIDEAGSAFHIEISEDRDSVLRKHYMA